AGEAALAGLALGGSGVECPGESDVDRRTTPLQDARELAHTSVGDGEGRALVADRNRDERRVRIVAGARLRRLKRAQQRECLEVDPEETDAGLLARVGVAVDLLAIGDDEEDATRDLHYFVRRLAQELR